MAKTRKQKFAEWMMHQSSYTADDLRAISNSMNLGIQVKTISTKGDFVIKFSESDPFIKPDEWYHNYRLSVKERYEEARSVFSSLFPQEDAESKRSSEGERKMEKVPEPILTEVPKAHPVEREIPTVTTSKRSNVDLDEVRRPSEQKTQYKRYSITRDQLNDRRFLEQTMVPDGYVGEGLFLDQVLHTIGVNAITVIR